MPIAAGRDSQADHILDAFFHTNCHLDTNTTTAADEYSAAIKYAIAVRDSAAVFHTYDHLDSIYYTILYDYSDPKCYSASDQYSSA